MNLPPLPLIDGALFIDNSGWVETFQTCYRYGEYKNLHLRVAADEKPALNFGSAIHLVLETRYRQGVDDTIPWNDIANVLTNFYNEHPSPIEDWRSLNWAMTISKRYFERYPIEEFSLLSGPDGKPLVELSFNLPLYTHILHKDKLTQQEIPVIYTGRIDLPFSHDGQTWVMDHKTTSMMGGQFFDRMRMSSQQKGYCWAFQQLTGQKVAGYVINGIRTKEPPLYIQDPNRKQGKDTPEKWWNESFQRERYWLTEGALDEWKQNVISMCKEFFYHYENDYMPMKTAWCASYGRCPYYQICTLSPEDRLAQLATGLYTANEWSPLKQPTQSQQ